MASYIGTTQAKLIAGPAGATGPAGAAGAAGPQGIQGEPGPTVLSVTPTIASNTLTVDVNGVTGAVALPTKSYAYLNKPALQAVPNGTTDVPFTLVQGSGITVAGAVITLTAGKTYEIECSIAMSGFVPATTSWAVFSVFNATTNVQLAGATPSTITPTPYAASESTQTVLKAVYTATAAANTIKIRTVAVLGTSNIVAGRSYLMIREL
jgi:hypothetical protein